MTESPQPNILVVDDEEPVRMVCSRMLTPLGYHVDTASNGEEAMAYFQKGRFDLLITDYRLPGKFNGLTLGRTVKEHFPHTQIIVMTAFPAVDTAVETLRLGCVDYLIKPFDQKELIRRVMTCLAPLTAA